MQRRNDEIRRLRQTDSKQWTYSKLSRTFRLSAERIRQICSGQEDFAKVVARTNIATQYGSYLDSLSDKQLEEEILSLKEPSRLKESVMKRGILVAYLRDKGLSYLKIGSLLKRNHTSIINLYNKYRDYYSTPR